ncbi:MAG: short-chain dehydrogenase [Hyphomicrobiales bacterium]|nr:short-chain dehydrogenase [Hyphomicrobiales bacterium]
MAVTLKPLSQQTIVITGASSGIGLATAQEAGRRGANVVLAARNEEALRQAAQDIVQAGGSATHVAADVGKPEDVERIVAAALTRFGGFDTWVNDAGVDMWGRIEEIPDEDSRRLFETNFWGLVYGSKVAARHLRQRGGALINVGSVASDRAFPLQGIYCASKHAVKAFTDALRMELEHDGAPVSVTLIKPASIATPLQEQAKNFMDKEVRLPSPLYAPEEVAYAILHAAEKPERDIYVGSAGRILSAFGTQAPRLTDIAGEGLLWRSQKSETDARPRRDNLHAAGPGGGRVHLRDPEGRSMRASYYTRATLNPMATSALVLAAGMAVGLAAKGMMSDDARRPLSRLANRMQPD